MQFNKVQLAPELPLQAIFFMSIKSLSIFLSRTHLFRWSQLLLRNLTGVFCIEEVRKNILQEIKISFLPFFGNKSNIFIIYL